MSKLKQDQIRLIAAEVAKSKIDSMELIEDLTDHICCLIEDDLRLGMAFDEAKTRAFGTVFPDGTDQEYKRSILLLTDRRLQRMKSILFAFSYIAIIIMTSSFLFKALHWPGAGTMLLVGASLFTFIFTPLFFMYLYRARLSRIISRKSQYIFGMTGIVILLTGIAFKAFHWPGASTMLLVGVLIINFVFLPLIFRGFYNATRQRSRLGQTGHKLFYLFAYLSIALFLLASFLKMLHWPGPAVILVFSIAIFNFGFLPLALTKIFRLT